MTNEGFQLARLHQVLQPVANLQRAIDFYRDVLGARHIATFDPPGLAFFDISGVRLMLDAIPEAQIYTGAPLYFLVDDLQQAHATLLARGVAFEEEPHMINRDDQGLFGEPGMETWMAFFRDPDGHLLAITSEVSPGTRPEVLPASG